MLFAAAQRRSRWSFSDFDSTPARNYETYFSYAKNVQVHIPVENGSCFPFIDVIFPAVTAHKCFLDFKRCVFFHRDACLKVLTIGCCHSSFNNFLSVFIEKRYVVATLF